MATVLIVFDTWPIIHPELTRLRQFRSFLSKGRIATAVTSQRHKSQQIPDSIVQAEVDLQNNSNVSQNLSVQTMKVAWVGFQIDGFLFTRS